MAYYQKFQLVRSSLITHFRECISENYERMFDMWLMCEADMVFGHGYQNTFKEHFGDYITDEINAQLWFAGKNIIYAINSFISLKNAYYELNELLEFVETFVSEQLDNFDNDYDTTEWFNSDNENIEETKEDNPQ
jgi:hypothetical protein